MWIVDGFVDNIALFRGYFRQLPCFFRVFFHKPLSAVVDSAVSRNALLFFPPFCRWNTCDARAAGCRFSTVSTGFEAAVPWWKPKNFVSFPKNPLFLRAPLRGIFRGCGKVWISGRFPVRFPGIRGAQTVWTSHTVLEKSYRNFGVKQR